MTGRHLLQKGIGIVNKEHTFWKDAEYSLVKEIFLLNLIERHLAKLFSLLR